MLLDVRALSDTINLGLPHALTNLLNARRKLLTVKFVTISNLTPLVTAHVNTATYDFSDFSNYVTKCLIFVSFNAMKF